MGYRSDVAAVIYSDGNGDVNDKYVALKMFMGTRFQALSDQWGEEFSWNDPFKRLEFRCEGIKWYDIFPEVTAFEAMLESLSEMGYDHEFLRIGEESDDVECRGSGNDYVLRVHRAIEWD